MGLFNFFRKSDSKANTADIKPLEVELHSHLLPGLDDGVQSFEESLEIIEKLVSLGYRKIITTPHVMGDFYKNTPEGILGKLAELKEEIRKAGINVEIHAAAEYTIDEWFPEKIKNNQILTFGNNYVLVETTFLNEPSNFTQTLFDLRIAGYQPVLAHPERYLYFHDNMEKYKTLFEKGTLFQMNLMSLGGYYSPQVKKAAEYLLHNKMINFVGSDIHSMKHLNVIEEIRNLKNYQKLLQLPLLNNSL